MQLEEVLQNGQEKNIFAVKDIHWKVVSPLALNGHESSKEMEFRIASLRGIVRYFWRAVQCQTTPKKLLEKETKMFGGTQPNTVASPVRFARLSVFRQMNQEIQPGTKISFQLRTENRDMLDDYARLIFLVGLLGALGKRARRGYGAIQPENDPAFQTLKSYKEALRHTLSCLQWEHTENKHKSCLFYHKEQKHPSPPHPTIRAIWIGAPDKDHTTIFNKFGEAFHMANQKGGGLGKFKKGRQAPLLFGTIRKIGETYYPIITEMQTRNTNGDAYENYKKNFLREMGVH